MTCAKTLQFPTKYAHVHLLTLTIKSNLWWETSIFSKVSRLFHDENVHLNGQLPRSFPRQLIDPAQGMVGQQISYTAEEKDDLLAKNLDTIVKQTTNSTKLHSQKTENQHRSNLVKQRFFFLIMCCAHHDDGDSLG